MGKYIGVKFADRRELNALQDHGYCVFHISKEDRQANHPNIGDVVHLLLDDSDRGRRMAVKLISEQELLDGSCYCVYAPIAVPFVREA